MRDHLLVLKAPKGWKHADVEVMLSEFRDCLTPFPATSIRRLIDADGLPTSLRIVLGDSVSGEMPRATEEDHARVQMLINALEGGG